MIMVSIGTFFGLDLPTFKKTQIIQYVMIATVCGGWYLPQFRLGVV